MKRTIRFRGKMLYNGEWIYGDLLHCNGCTYIFRKSSGGYKKYEVVPSTVCQFTVLKDKNGNEIYEGDIVRVTLSKIGAEGIGVVEWNNETCVFGLNLGGGVGSSSIAGTWHTIEVIGNIYDNPELLNQDK